MKKVQDETQLGRKGDPLGIAQEIEIWPYLQMLYARNRIRPGELDFEIQRDHLIPARRPDLVIINQEREPDD